MTLETQLQIQGYGYTRADQDGYNGEIVTATEHKEEEFFEAARQLLEAQEIEPSKNK